MNKRIVTFLLVFIVISMFVGFSYVNAGGVADVGLPPPPDNTNQAISVPWSEVPGAMTVLFGDRTPDRPLVFSEPSPDNVDELSELIVDVWYGSPQKFGQIGNPQQWINILGNASGIGFDGSLSYSLNDGADLPLSLGPDARRLGADGDFNVEIDYADPGLSPGFNRVVIKASDGITETKKTVNFNYTPGQTWPSTYQAVWNSSNNIQDTAQVVDGHWKISGNSVIIDADNWGYDRLLAIGDETWTDYEVTVPVTVFGLDPAGYENVSNGPSVGLGMRWQGHVNFAGEQPNRDWRRIGALGLYHWSINGPGFLEMFGRDWVLGAKSEVLKLNTPYIFKMSVQSVPDKSAYYRLKFWEASEDEPVAWDLFGYSGVNASAVGSLLLVAHHVDAKFGEVTVNDLDDLRLKVNVTVDGEGTTTFSPEQEDFGYSEEVRVKAFPDDGHDFVAWTGDYIGTDGRAIFRITKDMNITAHFIPKPPTILTIKIEGQGSVLKEPNKSEYLWGEEVSLTAIPADDQIFLYWTGDLTGIQNPTTIKMDADKQVTAVFGPKTAITPKSDDFSQCILDSRVWTLINPAGDAEFEMTGTAAKFKIPAGSRHDMWDDNADALRIMQRTLDQNFEVEVKFDTLPEEKFQMEGVLIEQDEDNWLRLSFHHDGLNLVMSAFKTVDGVSGKIISLPVNPGGSTKIFMRIERNDTWWMQTYSFNGNDWTTFAKFNQPLEVNSSGVFVGNAAQTAGSEPAFDARVDYFFNTAIPIDPEDQGNTVDVAVVGQGQVQVSPIKDTYQCGEKVTLTATPASEWLFADWSGDLSGRDNPAILTIEGDYDIVAKFSQGATVFLPSVMRKP